MRKNDQRSDHVKYYVRPLECKLAKDYFLDMSRFGSKEAFYENCVDLEAGDAKPQIRVHGRAAFNITNFAQFENIEFTGEDNLVQLIDGHDTELMQDIVDATPFKFCEHASEPTSYLESMDVTRMQGISDTFNYTCYSGFNATLNQIPTEVDTACAEQFV